MKHKPVIDDTIPHPNHGNGTQRRVHFSNGYGASVIQSTYSYGGDDGLYELAVMKVSGPNASDLDLTYDTPITNDVIGHLTPDGVDEILDQIASLPAVSTTHHA